jgi:tetratricopeptide (TPR) repeat protein
VVVGLVALGTYIMTLGYGFAFDDVNVIPVGWQLGTVDPLEVARTPVRSDSTVLPYYRPLIALTYWWDGFLWQGNPGGFHLTNVLLHALVSVLVFLVARRLLPVGPAPLLAGLLFAVHPIHVEAVAWVQGRVDLLSAVGVLLTVLLGLSGAEATEERKVLYWAASAMAFLLALLAKEVAVVAPLLTALVLVAEPRRGYWRRLRACLPLFGLQGAAFLFYFGLRISKLSSPAVGLFGSPPLADRILLALRVIPVYLRLLLWPVDLNPKHWVAPPSGILDWNVRMGLALLLVLGAVVLAWRRQVPGLGPGLAWLGLAWLPASNLVPIPAFVLAERYLYLPSVGFCIALAGVAAAAGALGDRWRRPLLATAAILLLSLGGLASAHAGLWRDPRTFYEGLVRLNPNSALAHNGLGAIFLDLGEEALAETEFREALRLHPRHAGALNNLGILAQRRGELVAARRFYGEALTARPNQAEVWNNLGSLYEAEGNLEQAAAAYLRAIRLDSTIPRFMVNLAGVLAAQGRRQDAANLLERAVKLDPTISRWQEALDALRTDGTP